MTKNKAIFFLALAVLSWSCGGVIVKSTAASPLAICCVLNGLGAAVLFLSTRRLTWTWSPKGLMAVVLFVSISITVTFALRMTTAANAMLLQFCSPVFAGVFGTIFLKQSLKHEDKMAIPLVLIGIALFFADQLEFGHFIGNCLGLLSGVAVAGYTTMMKFGDDQQSPLDMTLTGSLATCIVCLPFALSHPVPASDILPLIFCGVVVCGLGWTFYARAIEAVSPTAALIITTPEAILNPLLVAVVIGERPGILALIGAAVVLSAVSWYTIVSIRHTDPITVEPPPDGQFPGELPPLESAKPNKVGDLRNPVSSTMPQSTPI